MRFAVLLSYLTALTLVSCLTGCHTAKGYTAIDRSLSPRPTDASVDVYAPGESPDKPFKVVGIVTIGDTGFSVNCGFEEVVESAKEQARAAGGDAIRITELRPPDSRSTCYRITASVIVYRQADRPPSASGQQARGGSGFAVSADGLVVTAFHVVNGAETVEVRFPDGAWLPAQVVSASESTDLAVLRTSATIAAPLQVVPAKAVALGARVFTIGYPAPEILGASAKYSDGVISSLAGIQSDPTMFQTTVSVQPGSSGGPLLDEGGRVIGVVHATINELKFLKSTESFPQSVNWAVKSDYLLPLLPTIEVQNDQRTTDSMIDRCAAAVCQIRTR